MFLIDTQQELNECIHTLTRASQRFVACDTEFIRQKTFYPELCVIQCSIDGQAFLIDALAFEAHAFAPLFFGNEKTFVFHSSKQDLEILYHLYGKLPPSVFDSQVAGQFLGLGESIAYDGLVKHYLHLEIDKSQQHTNWKRRPLSAKQIEYASSDVIHLAEIYPRMLEDLEAKGHLAWAMEEMKGLSDTAPFETVSSARLSRLHIPKKKYPLAMALLNLREKYARALNVNRMQCLSDQALETLLKIHDLSELKDYLVRTLPQTVHTDAFLAEILTCVTSEEHQTAPPPVKISVMQQKQLEKLRAFRDAKAAEHEVPRSLLATSQDMKDLIFMQKGRLATTWRKELFGEFLQG